MVVIGCSSQRNKRRNFVSYSFGMPSQSRVVGGEEKGGKIGSVCACARVRGEGEERIGRVGGGRLVVEVCVGVQKLVFCVPRCVCVCL